MIQSILSKIGLVPIAAHKRLLHLFVEQQALTAHHKLLVMELEAAYKKATGKTYVKRKTK